MDFQEDETIIQGSPSSTGGTIEVNAYLTEAPSTTLACHVVCQECVQSRDWILLEKAEYLNGE